MMLILPIHEFGLYVSWDISCHAFLVCSVSVRNQLVALSELPCQLLAVSPLLHLRFSLSLNFSILIMMCLGVGLFGFILIGLLEVAWLYPPPS